MDLEAATPACKGEPVILNFLGFVEQLLIAGGSCKENRVATLLAEGFPPLLLARRME
jgi:hypothetical protein